MRRLAGSLLLTLAFASVVRADEKERATSSVGMPTTVEQLVLTGPELEVAPIDDLKTPVVVRIVDVFPHGSDFRYNLNFYGLLPGTYDLAKFLRRKDGKPGKDLPPVYVTVTSLLPPGQIEPHAVQPSVIPRFGGYRLLMLVLAVAWSAGFVFLLYAMRRKAVEAEAVAARRLTLSDRLRPLVEGAISGTLQPGQHAELERLLIGYWTRKLAVQDLDPAASMAALRRDPEAGAVLRQLEDWLHRPGGAKDVDISALLRPYANIPAEAFETEAAAA